MSPERPLVRLVGPFRVGEVDGDPQFKIATAEIVDEAARDAIGLIYGRTEEEARDTAQLIAEVLTRVTDGVTRARSAADESLRAQRRPGESVGKTAHWMEGVA